ISWFSGPTGQPPNTPSVACDTFLLRHFSLASHLSGYVFLFVYVYSLCLFNALIINDLIFTALPAQYTSRSIAMPAFVLAPRAQLHHQQKHS
ncbi:hypothetical protein BV25DRAFT_1824812, partial [Artomyces pyxidatus]